jgi:hypothetical protein
MASMGRADKEANWLNWATGCQKKPDSESSGCIKIANYSARRFVQKTGERGNQIL